MSRDVRRPGELKLGTIAGIPVLVRSSWLLVALLIAFVMAPRVEQVAPGLGVLTYVAGLVFAVLLYGSVLLHEAAHAVAARAFGLPVRAIRLEFLGGVTEIERPSRTPWQEFVISVVGPITSIAVGLVSLTALLVTDPAGLVRLSLEGLAIANLFVGAFNLLPGIPLDGGKVLKALVWRITGSADTGTLVAAWGGRVVAVLAFAIPLGLSAAGFEITLTDYLIAGIIAMFIWSGASATLQYVALRRRVPSLDARALARPLVSVTEETPISQAVLRSQEAGVEGILVRTTDGRLSGLVNDAALQAIPEERRPWMPISTVARTWDDALAIPADARGDDLLQAMARTPAPEYLLIEPDGTTAGLLRAADVEAALSGRTRRR